MTTQFIALWAQNQSSEKLLLCVAIHLNMSMLCEQYKFPIICFYREKSCHIIDNYRLYAGKMMGPPCDPSVHDVIGLLHRLILDFSVSGLCRRHGFRSISQVCFGSISNFICMLMVVIGRSLLIFSDATFKMAAWCPYWIFCFPDFNFSLAVNKLQTSVAQYLCIWVGAYWFSATLISKWPPGSHIGFFGFQTLTLLWLWIWTWNFYGPILVYMSGSLVIFSDLIF